MNAYLFAGCITRTQIAAAPSEWCASKIVPGRTAKIAQAGFESWLVGSPGTETPMTNEIRAVAAAQFVDQLLTESGPVTFDWPHICQQAEASMGTTPEEDFAKGYWVDVDEIVRPDGLSPDIQTLQHDLPEDICSGLNWSADKQTYFILSVISLPEPPPEPTGEETVDEAAEFEKQQLAELKATYPELADKEAAALIQARSRIMVSALSRSQ